MSVKCMRMRTYSCAFKQMKWKLILWMMSDRHACFNTMHTDFAVCAMCACTHTGGRIELVVALHRLACKNLSHHRILWILCYCFRLTQTYLTRRRMRIEITRAPNIYFSFWNHNEKKCALFRFFITPWFR